MSNTAIGLAEQLAAEFEHFYRETIFKRGLYLRLFSGVLPDRRQFIIETAPLELDTQNRRNFLVYLCKKEKLIAYAYGTPMLMVDKQDRPSEAFEIITADISKNIVITMKLIEQNKQIIVGDRSENTIAPNGSWQPYTDLFTAQYVGGDMNEQDFEIKWNGIREKIRWLR